MKSGERRAPAVKNIILAQTLLYNIPRKTHRTSSIRRQQSTRTCAQSRPALKANFCGLNPFTAPIPGKDHGTSRQSGAVLTVIETMSFRTATRRADAYMNRPPVSTKYVNARLLGSPAGNLSCTCSSYLRTTRKICQQEGDDIQHALHTT